MIPIHWFLELAAVLFVVGSLGVILRRNALIMLMGIELQLNAANLTLVAFSRAHHDAHAQAFAAHLDRMQREGSTFTVEGYLDGVRTFADSANRAEGGRRWAAVALVGLLLAVAAYVVYDALLFVVGTWL